MARVLDSVTMPIKKNGTTTPQEYVNNPKSTAPQFSASTAYTVGQYVFYEKKLYRFKAAHAAGAWNAAHVDEVTVGEELTSHGADITELKADITDKADKSEALASYVVNTASGAVALFDDGADNVPVKNLVAQIVPRQLGTGDPSPENVREIVGRTGTGVHRTGVNLLGGELLVNNTKLYMPSATVSKENKYVSFAAGATTKTTDSPNGLLGFFKCKENTAYTFIITYGKSSNTGSNMKIYYTDGTYDAVPPLTDVNAKETKVVVTNPDKTVKSLTKTNSSGSTRLYYDECGVFEGVLTAEDFVPYEGQTVNIDWSDDAGTVYGGTLDVTTGVLTVKQHKCTVTKEKLDSAVADSYYGYNATWGAYVRNLNYAGSGDNKWHDPSNAGGAYRNVCSFATCVVNNKSISSSQYCTSFRSSAWTNWQEFYDAVVAMENNGDPLEYIADLRTPVTYQLTPTEVATLLGQNNIWADTGDVEVEYRADTKLYIEKLTAPTEDDMVANTTIPDATYFMIGNTLYLSTTTIPAGDTINPGTNCTLMNLASALNALNS